MEISEILEASPVVPVIVLNNVEDAIPLAEALLQAGVRTLEVTLRTDSALQSIEKIKASVPDAIVGAGTVNNARQLQQCVDAGVDFMVSPGFFRPLADAAIESRIAYLPGVSTASELMQASDAGFRYLKFFPAEPAGGVNMLKGLAGPFADHYFCPTGGIGRNNCADYLALRNVVCVGGSWLTPNDLISDQNWTEITLRAMRDLEILRGQQS